MSDPEPVDGLDRPEVVAPTHRGVRPVFLLALALVLSLTVLVATRVERDDAVDLSVRQARSGWFAHNKAHCNALEVSSFLAGQPPSAVEPGLRAACFAIAGKIDEARRVIAALPPADQMDAVNQVFIVAHPIADAGDDASAGPIMELVVEFQPDQYMALYHAGMARAIAGDDTTARRHLVRFLSIYQNRDYWGDNARRALEALDRPRSQRTVQQSGEGSIVY